MDDMQKIISALMDNELAVSELYKVYATRFPEMADFWNHLANDEENHAEWIKTLNEEISKGNMVINPNRFKLPSLQGLYDYIMGLIYKARRDDIPLTNINALALSKSLEDALIEKRFFEIFETDSVMLKNVLNKLRIATEKHREIVAVELERTNSIQGK